jgi:glycosyltransferase involved in cell wall biosynthesis
MLIVHIVTNLMRGGAEKMLKRLIEEQIARGGVRHHVISLREKATIGPELEAMGVPVEALGLGGIAGGPRAIARLRRRLRELEPDIVQTWLYHADLIGGLAARLAGVRNVVWSIRATHIAAREGTSRMTSVIRFACARLSRLVPRRIVYVAEAAREVHEGLGYDAAKSAVIPNGYRLPDPREAAAEREAARSALGAGPETLLVGTAGRFNEVKDYPTFVAAAGLLARRYPQARFAMIGRNLDAENERLAGWIAEAGVAERMHLLGERTPLEPWLAALDLFCLHSVSEGFPNVVAEAMAAGVPCVVTDVGDAARLVGNTGLVVARQQPSALAEALATLVEEGPEARKSRGERARRRVEENYSLAAVATKYEAIYAALLPRRAEAR